MLIFLRRISLALFLLAFVPGIAAAKTLSVPQPPTKKLVIYNDSTKNTIYPVISIGIKSGNPDLWMQAQFVSDFPNKDPYPPFPTTLCSTRIMSINAGRRRVAPR
jgi:hypothetical protein